MGNSLKRDCVISQSDGLIMLMVIMANAMHPSVQCVERIWKKKREDSEKYIVYNIYIFLLIYMGILFTENYIV